MCAALPNNQALYFCTTNRAGLTLAIVHAEIILELTTAIDPVYTGAIAANAFLQHRPDRFPQRPGLFPIYRIGNGLRVKPRNVQGFVGVDISHASQKGLVEQ
jgi:hypothetical protein